MMIGRFLTSKFLIGALIICICLLSFKNKSRRHGDIKFLVEASFTIPSGDCFSRIFEDSVNFNIDNSGIHNIPKDVFVQQMDSFFSQNKPAKLELLSDFRFDISKRNFKWMYYSTSNKQFKVNIDASLDEYNEHYHASLISIEQINF